MNDSRCTSLLRAWASQAVNFVVKVHTYKEELVNAIWLAQYVQSLTNQIWPSLVNIIINSLVQFSLASVFTKLNWPRYNESNPSR